MNQNIRKVNYVEEYKKQLKKNILKVRGSISKPDMVLKIKNHSDKFNRDYEEVENKILSDDMYAEIFAKDPNKQNIYEKLAAQYIKTIPDVQNFKNLPNNYDLFVVDGVITNKRGNDVKSVDFIFEFKNKNIYSVHKYIKALNGGAQTNQYNDVRNFLRNCKKINTGDDYFIAICDGDFFTNKIELLNEEFGSFRVKILTIEEFERFLNNLPI
jgi:hypothetical protein